MTLNQVRTSLVLASASLAAALLAIATPSPAAEAVAVGWTDTRDGVGRIRPLATDEPWNWVGEAIEVGRRPQLRARGRRLLVTSAPDASLSLVNTRTWAVRRTQDVSAGGTPLDATLVDRRRAWMTLQHSPLVLEVDMVSGASSVVADLSDFSGRHPGVHATTVEVVGGRAFVGGRVVDVEGSPVDAPAFLAVFETASRAPVDADPAVEGTQPIFLEGTFTKMKGQVLGRARRLFVSATGVFFDSGGIEAIDLDGLTSLGLLVREHDGEVGADLGAFAMLGRRRGYLVFSTDLLLSSHLHRFRAGGDVEANELRTLLDYFMPALVLSRRTRTLFAPDDGTSGDPGVLAYESATGILRTANPLPVPAAPSDLEKIRRPRD